MTLQPLHDTMAALLTEATARLTPTPRRSLLAPGDTEAWDDCCTGQVWVRLAQLVPGPTPAGCAPASWRATLELGVLRCAATVDSLGRAPTPQVLTAETQRMIADMHALLAAICDLAGPVAVEGWTPRGPDGGCVGGVWRIVVTL